MDQEVTPKRQGVKKHDVLAARVYWAIGGLATAMIAFLYWLTAAINIPLPPA